MPADRDWLIEEAKAADLRACAAWYVLPSGGTPPETGRRLGRDLDAADRKPMVARGA